MSENGLPNIHSKESCRACMREEELDVLRTALKSAKEALEKITNLEIAGSTKEDSMIIDEMVSTAEDALKEIEGNV